MSIRIQGTTVIDDSRNAVNLNSATIEGKRSDFGTSSDWDAIGFANLTNVHMQGHPRFWVGAGNGTWFTGTANAKTQASGLASDASRAHDLLITTMQSTSTYDRGITFSVDNSGNGNSGWRLGKWHSGDARDSSKLVVDGGLFVKGGYTDEFDYYANDYSAYFSARGGQAYWGGDTGWDDPSITASTAIQIQSGNTTTNTRNPQLQFHQYGYGGVQIRYDGPGNRLYLESRGSGRLTWTRNKTDSGYIDFGPANGSHAHIYTDRPNFYFNKQLTVNGGSQINTSDIRANIFYDQNNTGYYIDPASTSVIDEILIGGGTVRLRDATGNYGSLECDGGGTGGYEGFSIGGRSVFMHDNGSVTGIYNDVDNEWFWYAERNSRMRLFFNGVQQASTESGYFLANNQMRAPIYYDSNNTGYYADPASTSRFNSVEADGFHSKDRGDFFTFYGDNNDRHSISSRNNTGGADDDIRINSYGAVYINLDSNNNNSSAADFRIGRHGSGTGSITNLGLFDVYGDSLYVYSAYSFRSPIFYDSNNTGYYVNPASTSVLNSIYLQGTIRHNGDTNTYMEFHASDQWRVVTGGSERLEVNNTATKGSRIDATSQMRSPIYYDINNTSYYMDPSSTSYVAYLGRRAHNTGHLVGSYNSVGANSTRSNPIYTIGSSYNPASTSLGNMYGIGYTYTTASFINFESQSGWGMYVASDGDARVWLNGTRGNIVGTGNVIAYASDERLKTNIKNITSPIEKIRQINGVEYDWLDNIESEYDFHPTKMHEVGVLAQEIEKVLPEAVMTAPFNGNYTKKCGVDHNFLTVDYERIVPLLIEGIKEMSDLIQEQQIQIQELKEIIKGN